MWVIVIFALKFRLQLLNKTRVIRETKHSLHTALLPRLKRHKLAAVNGCKVTRHSGCAIGKEIESTVTERKQRDNKECKKNADRLYCWSAGCEGDITGRGGANEHVREREGRDGRDSREGAIKERENTSPAPTGGMHHSAIRW